MPNQRTIRARSGGGRVRPNERPLLGSRLRAGLWYPVTPRRVLVAQRKTQKFDVTGEAGGSLLGRLCFAASVFARSIILVILPYQIAQARGATVTSHSD